MASKLLKISVLEHKCGSRGLCQAIPGAWVQEGSRKHNLVSNELDLEQIQ